jgi:hypothetical protein
MFGMVNFFTLAIMDTVNDFIEPLIEDLTDYLTGIEPWAAGLILLAAGIFILVGFFRVLKKFIKLFIVLAILGGAFYVVYTYTELLDNILKIM